MIDPRTLVMFQKVCDAGSISGAARELNISQPSVSSAILSLEGRLGATLFERTRTGIVLTPVGTALRMRAEMLDHLLRDAEADVAAARAGRFGPIRVGGTPGALTSLLPAGIAGLDKELPEVTLTVLERPERELVSMLRNGEIELAFVTTGIEEPAADLAERTLSRDPFALVVAATHPLPNQPISLRRAHSLRWVLPEAQGGFRRQLDALFIAVGIGIPRDVVRSDSLLTTKAIVLQGQRVTILPIRVAASELAAGTMRAIPIAEAAPDRSVGVRWLRGRRHSPLASRLLEAIEAHP